MTKQEETNQEFIPYMEVPLGHEQSRFRYDDVNIDIPSNHLELLDAALTRYKKWLKENSALQAIADEAETEEERTEALRNRSYHFKQRFSGVLAKDTGVRLSPSKIKKMWEKFIQQEYRDFFASHTNLKMEDVLNIGVDKFVYVMGWMKPSDVASWRKNKVRVGYCCHCKDQFIPMMLQTNQGMCLQCRPLYSPEAMRIFVRDIMSHSARYHNNENDLMMDFHIMFYSDPEMRQLFLKDNPFSQELEARGEEQDVQERKEVDVIE